MKSLINIIAIALFLSLYSCQQPDPNKQIDEGTVNDKTYTSEEIGWTIEIPDGWSVVEIEKTKANNEKGLKALEETLEGEIDYSGLKHLIAFQKSQFNQFHSTSEPFELEYEGEWEENNEVIKELLYETFTNQGISLDTSSSTASIDGLDFAVFHITIYGRDGEIILNQEMYSRYINGYDFGVSLNYNNEKDRKAMMDAWENSKFKKS